MLLRDGVTHHPKVIKAGPEAAWLWVAAIDYSRQHLTDGYVPASVLPTLGVFRAKLARLVARLVEVHLFIPENDGYRIHDFLEHNDSKAQVEAKRRAAARRTSDWRERRACRDGDSGVTASREDTYTLHPHHSRARVPAFGVGTVTGLSSSSEGESEREDRRAEPRTVLLADDVGQLWIETAGRHGTDLRLGFNATQTDHLMRLAKHYSREELVAAMECWWSSDYTQGRNLGLFASQVAEVQAHLMAKSPWPFRAPETVVAQMKAEQVAKSWVPRALRRTGQAS